MGILTPTVLTETDIEATLPSTRKLYLRRIMEQDPAEQGVPFYPTERYL